MPSAAPMPLRTRRGSASSIFEILSGITIPLVQEPLASHLRIATPSKIVSPPLPRGPAVGEAGPAPPVVRLRFSQELLLAPSSRRILEATGSRSAEPVGGCHGAQDP